MTMVEHDLSSKTAVGAIGFKIAATVFFVLNYFSTFLLSDVKKAGTYFVIVIF